METKLQTALKACCHDSSEMCKASSKSCQIYCQAKRLWKLHAFMSSDHRASKQNQISLGLVAHKKVSVPADAGPASEVECGVGEARSRPMPTFAVQNAQDCF